MALAILAEALYLANLLLLPGLAFGALLWLFWTRRPQAPDLAVNHLNQTVAASLWAGALLIAANLLIIALGGYQSANTWTVVIVYFTTCHASLVLLGMVGLSKSHVWPALAFSHRGMARGGAMSVGKWSPDDASQRIARRHR